MDVESSPDVRQAILELVEQGVTSLVVDLKGVDFMDSSGLSALVTGMKALQKASGAIRICHANAQIRTALRLTMLDRILPVKESVAAALDSMEEGEK
jgi:anti-anti-sigma factor